MKTHLQPVTEIISRYNRDEGLRDDKQAAEKVIEYLTKQGFEKITDVKYEETQKALYRNRH